MAVELLAEQELRWLLTQRLAGTQPAAGPEEARFPGVRASEVDELRALLPAQLAPAAVLMPIVDRPEGLSMLLTQRATQLKHHAVQIRFPGGRIEPGDAGPLAAALREAEEEIGLPPDRVTLAGYLRPQLIVTGYWVVPVVGFVEPGFTLKLDPVEVEAALEVPLRFVLDAANRTERDRHLGRLTFKTTEIRHDGRLIWGATAAMLVALSALLEEPA